MLHLSISLLTNFTPCLQWDDWVIGQHGITIEYGGISATYLPEVAAEQGWDKEETVEELMRKGGWTGRVGDKERREMKVVRYESEKGSMSWEEYIAWKEGEKKRREDRGGASAGKDRKRSRRSSDEHEHDNRDSAGGEEEDDDEEDEQDDGV